MTASAMKKADAQTAEILRQISEAAKAGETEAHATVPAGHPIITR
jgi:hypothetical protein